MVEALDALPAAAAVLPGQQPQADPGLLPRPRHRRRHRPRSGSSTSSTSCPPRRSPTQLVERRRRDRRAGRALPRAGHDPGRRHLVRRAGPRARRRGRAARRPASPSWPRSSRAARRRAGERVTVEANLRIARGLDYYTGTVVEIFMAGYERLKSVGGGGRYDALADDGRTTYPGVGVSLRRLPHAGPADRRRRARRQPARCPAPCWSPWPTRSRAAASDAVADALRARGIAVRGRRRRRRSSASRSGTPSGGASRTSGSPAADGSHEVKDIRTGDQVAADPATWTPPTEDLRPQVTSTSNEETKQ